MKKVVILLVILAALIAVAMFSKNGLMQSLSSSSRKGAPDRELLLPELANKEIGGLRIHEGDKKVTLSLANGKWTVAERSGYSASFDKVQRVVRLGGFINAMPDFLETPKVMNGASDLMVTAFGDRGRHARTTIGVSVLPLDAAVEVEGMFEVS